MQTSVTSSVSLGTKCPRHAVQGGRQCAPHRNLARLPPTASRAFEFSAAGAALAAVVLPAAGVLGWRFSLYSQLEVITARMLGVHVPPSSATVVQLHGSTRALFYYPKNTKQVIAVAPDLTPGLWGEAGVQALMPCRALKQSPADLGSLATGSVDAVTCLGALASCPEDQQGRVLAEVVRVLKPGAPCVIIEPVREGASPVRWLLSQVQGKALAAARLEELLGIAGLEVVQVDVALEGADPHAVGLVRRSSAAWQALPGRAAVAAPQAKGFKAGSRK